MMRLRPYRTVEDRIEGVVLSFVDITARRQTEARLRESEAKYRRLFETMDEGYLLAEVLRDDAGRAVDIRYHDANPAAERDGGRRSCRGRLLSEVAPGFEPHWLEMPARVAEGPGASTKGSAIWDARGREMLGLAEDPEPDGGLARAHPSRGPAERWRQHLDECLREGRLFDMEYRVIRPGGDERTVHGTGAFQQRRDGPGAAGRRPGARRDGPAALGGHPADVDPGAEPPGEEHAHRRAVGGPPDPAQHEGAGRVLPRPSSSGCRRWRWRMRC
jgi:hypothetical protein